MHRRAPASESLTGGCASDPAQELCWILHVVMFSPPTPTLSAGLRLPTPAWWTAAVRWRAAPALPMRHDAATIAPARASGAILVSTAAPRQAGGRLAFDPNVAPTPPGVLRRHSHHTSGATVPPEQYTAAKTIASVRVESTNLTDLSSFNCVEEITGGGQRAPRLLQQPAAHNGGWGWKGGASYFPARVHAL